MNECALALAESMLLVQHVETWRKVRHLGIGRFESDDPLDSLCAEPVVFRGDRLFDLARDLRDSTGAVIAVLIPARDEFDEIVDIAAWLPDKNKLALWRGAVAMLGQNNVYEPRLDDPLVAHESVADWLRSRRRGIHIIDPLRAAMLFAHLRPTLGVRSESFGRRLRTTLIVPAHPVVVSVRAAA